MLKRLVPMLALSALALAPPPNAFATHSFTEPRSDFATGCAVSSILTTCSSTANLTVASGATPEFCVGTSPNITKCRAQVACSGSGFSSLSGDVDLECDPHGTTSCSIPGTTGGACPPAPMAGYSGYINAGTCDTFRAKVTTTNAIGEAVASAAIQVCVDPIGPHFH
jgi:hypothetical protein